MNLQNFPISALVFLFVILLHVLGQVAKFLAKKKQEERARQEAQARRMQDLGLGVGNPQASIPPRRIEVAAAPPSRPPAATGPARLDELAQRRQAQLEQLRQRREVRRSTTISQPAAPARSQPTTVGRRSADNSPIQPPSQQAPQMRAGMQVQDSDNTRIAEREMQSQRQREAQQQRQSAMEPSADKQRDAQDRLHRKEVVRRKAQAVQRGEDFAESVRITSSKSAASRAARDAEANIVEAPAARNFAGTIADQMRSPKSLRQLLVLKELLDRPVALRSVN